MSTDDERYADGMRTRREVLGHEHVDRAQAASDDFTGDFQEFITRYAWGTLWTREGIGRRERSLVTLALLAGLGREGELPLHVRGALNNGVTRDEIKEVFLHVAVYAGVPAANSAFASARRTFDELADTAAAGNAE
jgi:4-carboxymuconolactone decarboxylase